MRNIYSSLVLILLSAFNINAQNITNTIGPGGVFTIKDAATNYFSISQRNGDAVFLKNLELGNVNISTSLVGVITKNGTRFIHNYQAAGTTGYNTFIGVNAGNFTMNGSGPSASRNTSVGYGSLSALTTGYNNSAFGNASLNQNTAGNGNSAFGNASLSQNTTGNFNSAFGDNVLYSNSTGYNNSAFGENSLYTNTTGNTNSAFGSFTLFWNSTGYGNSVFGNSSMNQNSTGYYNSAFGCYSLYYNTTGYSNSAFGNLSLNHNTAGIYNSAFGDVSLSNNTTGDLNSAFGYKSLYNNITGYYNSAFGVYSLNNNTTGYYNSAVGVYSLNNNTTGYENSAFGDRALSSNTTGYYNSAFGHDAGSIVLTGSNLTLIGHNAQPTSNWATNEITLGDGNVIIVRSSAPYYTSLSDARDKKNIQDLQLGIDFLMKIKPRQFNWDKRDWYENNMSDGSKMQKNLTAGFIAQELEKVLVNENVEWLDLVYKNNPNKIEATPGKLLPIIVKAIQELKEENNKLKKEKDEQLAKLNSLNEALIKKLDSYDESQKMIITEIKKLREEKNQSVTYSN